MWSQLCSAKSHGSSPAENSYNSENNHIYNEIRQIEGKVWKSTSRPQLMENDSKVHKEAHIVLGHVKVSWQNLTTNGQRFVLPKHWSKYDGLQGSTTVKCTVTMTSPCIGCVVVLLPVCCRPLCTAPCTLWSPRCFSWPEKRRRRRRKLKNKWTYKPYSMSSSNKFSVTITSSLNDGLIIPLIAPVLTLNAIKFPLEALFQSLCKWLLCQSDLGLIEVLTFVAWAFGRFDGQFLAGFVSDTLSWRATDL